MNGSKIVVFETGNPVLPKDTSVQRICHKSPAQKRESANREFLWGFRPWESAGLSSPTVKPRPLKKGFDILVYHSLKSWNMITPKKIRDRAHVRFAFPFASSLEQDKLFQKGTSSCHSNCMHVLPVQVEVGRNQDYTFHIKQKVNTSWLLSMQRPCPDPSTELERCRHSHSLHE